MNNLKSKNNVPSKAKRNHMVGTFIEARRFYALERILDASITHLPPFEDSEKFKNIVTLDT